MTLNKSFCQHTYSPKDAITHQWNFNSWTEICIIVTSYEKILLQKFEDMLNLNMKRLVRGFFAETVNMVYGSDNIDE